ncbi:loader and inhibitor of phage G40P [SAR86 cluster bacterium SAR86E]|uniref:Loader and inhibitor of phage G40P n=1 Tax=SAR86 cluster bacterium SAR86E TaxID=1208365 RepID=K6H0Z4_9GAMM|nr:loader and inhibitor of phage G40P [SAR86 cluster bacterium SAR86E]
MTPGQKTSISDRKGFIEAIDNLFLKMELSYHYQFYKVFGTDDRLREAKKIWAQSLKKYSTESIDDAIENVIQSNDYLPTLTEILKACAKTSGIKDIPSPQEAFIEAQKSSSPRKPYPWSHPIVYWAGREMGWDILNNSQKNNDSFEIYTKIYRRMIGEMKNGKKFNISAEHRADKPRSLDTELLESLRKKHNL